MAYNGGVLQLILLLVGLLLLLAWLLFLTVRAAVFFGTMLFGAPYVDSNERDVAAIVKLARVKEGERAIDLGSGDGRLVLALARAGARASGIEINPLLVHRSRTLLAKASVRFTPQIIRGSFWTHDLSSYDVVVFYGTTYLLPRLADKLRRELKPGARVISNYFALPGWHEEGSRGKIRRYLVT